MQSNEGLSELTMEQEEGKHRALSKAGFSVYKPGFPKFANQSVGKLH